MTKQDLIDALAGYSKANEAIFWWCFAWNGGVKSDLYAIMCEIEYVPDPRRQWAQDKDVRDALTKLDRTFGPMVEHALLPVRLRDVQEGQVLIAGKGFPCIPNRWPCRVYRHHGGLGVACSGGVHGIKLLPGSETTFHPLTEDPQGYVIGFRR